VAGPFHPGTWPWCCGTFLRRFLAGSGWLSFGTLSAEKGGFVGTDCPRIFLIAEIAHDQLKLAFVSGKNKFFRLFRCHLQCDHIDANRLTLVLGLVKFSPTGK